MCARKQTPDILTEIMEGISTPKEDEALADMSMIAPTRRKSQTKKTASKAISAPRAKAPRTAPPPVQKPVQYEYSLVTFQDHKGWRPRFIDGKPVADWMSGPLIHQYLNELSEQGWELTAASSGEPLYGTSDRHQLYFKRAIKV
jgi:hypothetical protein